ncbi:unnamed protein product [Sphagnum balticum]
MTDKIDKSVLAHAKLHAQLAGVNFATIEKQVSAFDHFMKKALNSKESNVENTDEKVPNLFDASVKLPEIEDDKNDELDEEIVEVAQVLPKAPELPVILFYDSKTHNKRRYYSNGLKGKPEWSESKDGAFVFQSHDHLRLASLYCRHYGYKGLDIETVI